MSVLSKYCKWCVDLIVTLLLWGYFTCGYLFFFFPVYLFAYLFSKNRQYAFQRLNHLFYRGFLLLARTIIPLLEIRIPEEIRSLRSSVIICNHLSYLDPILMISLFEKQRTIVKGVFFKTPVFSWSLKTAGYVPSETDEDLFPLMIDRIESMRDYLASGGNLFVFPEGTRSRNHKLGPFGKGAFVIARRCHATIHVLCIKNTNKLFQPGKFLFDTSGTKLIEIEQLGTIVPDYESETFSISSLIEQVRSLYEKKCSYDSEGVN